MYNFDFRLYNMWLCATDVESTGCDLLAVRWYTIFWRVFGRVVNSPLLFSSYHAEVSIGCNLPNQIHPASGIAGKVKLSSWSALLVLKNPLSPSSSGVLTCTLYEPFLPKSQSFVDPRQTIRTVVLHFCDINPVGTLEHIIGATEPCSLRVRVVLPDPTAFWAFAYLMVKPLANAEDIATDVRANGRFITQMLHYFKADQGQEYFEGAPGSIVPLL
ncbi:hypothetical protein B0H11DRAFT_1933993 [Mycena galericulata]|nr:hypothetical protein B0H11DRAFT_1933993 [Mycena galericulata]